MARRTKAQREWADRNRAKIAAYDKARRSTPEGIAKQAEQRACYNNQRNSDLGWRWMKFSERRNPLEFEHGDVSMIGGDELQNPSFVFVYRGVRRVELWAELNKF